MHVFCHGKSCFRNPPPHIFNLVFVGTSNNGPCLFWARLLLKKILINFSIQFFLQKMAPSFRFVIGRFQSGKKNFFWVKNFLSLKSFSKMSWTHPEWLFMAAPGSFVTPACVCVCACVRVCVCACMDVWVHGCVRMCVWVRLGVCVRDVWLCLPIRWYLFSQAYLTKSFSS